MTGIYISGHLELLREAPSEDYFSSCHIAKGTGPRNSDSLASTLFLRYINPIIQKLKLSASI